MATASEFGDWYDDYAARWPAVADYAERHADERLLDTWQQTLAAFDVGTLEAVTAGIIAGKIEPVDNFKLGTFADEIRRRCRAMLDEQRRESDRWTADKASPFTPVQDCDIVQSLLCGIACDQLLSEATGDPVDTDCRRFAAAGGMSTSVPYDAAIILADSHTKHEEAECMRTLAGVGITWGAITERASLLRSRGVTVLRNVEDLA